MQDRYTGDIGDFAKFAILRGLFGNSDLDLGIVWYLTTQRADPSGDGRHTGYLTPNSRNNSLFRSCDPELYDCLGKIVSRDERNVAAFTKSALLPPSTIYFDPLLTYEGIPLKERPAVRTAWAQGALASTASCDVVMFDPDNGFEVKSSSKHSAKGTKYVFFDELAEYVERGQTVVVYQHANRSGSVAAQAQRRLAQMRDALPLRSEPFALIWRSFSARSFLIAPAHHHSDPIREGVAALLRGPLAKHLRQLVA